MTEPAQLLERVRAGDATAWQELVKEYTPLLWRIARSSSLSPDEAADAVQSTWLRMVEQLPTLEAQSVPAWLTTTVRREAQRLFLARSQVDSASAAPPADPEAVVVQQERDAVLWRAMRQLPLRCQTLVQAMLDRESPSYSDLANALSMPVGSIGPTRARCLKRLQVLVETMGLRDDDVLATEDSLVQALRRAPRVPDTVPPEVISSAVQVQEPSGP